ncbi:hypothetical protein [Alteribacillus bidgolensis]|uniref:Uncharacterized protein n=1 Tax=Alteribacillus bidgolensis TaxID=930129 RepID=A0A1G8CPE7_9BACI|nr:hypothetical protein [Alteribacillus bidgolensis]SDH47306.1 hypothetical protein SAMN05216352_101400 [Alteribacillus bidgolensis]
MILKYVIKVDLPHTLSLKERFICSEVIDHSYYRAGINLFPHRSPGDIAPADFLKSDRLSVVCIKNDA